MLYIRADMNDVIATGHIMRCLSIADAAREQGENTIFIVADEQALSLLKKRGYETIVLHTQWDDMESELPYLIEEIQSREIKSILIDSYQVTELYLQTLRTEVYTAYIDDINAFLYPVDAIICYANYWNKFSYMEKYENTKLYLGPQYAPLRKEFSGCGRKKTKERVENLLLLSGGTDPYNVLDRVLDNLDKNRYEQIHVICGMYYPNIGMLTEKYHSCANIHIEQAVTDIDRYMKEADMAVSAGGSTLYELCACGTPTISYSMADNQLDNVNMFQQEGIIDYAGDVRSDEVVQKIIMLLDKYYRDAALRIEKSGKMQQLVDGKGASRIAKEMMVF